MNLALFLDLDNIKPNLEELEKMVQGIGYVIERRAFSNVPSVRTAYGSKFRRYGYRLEITAGDDVQPQEVDQLIEKSALELANNPSRHIEAVAVVSNDNDYAPLFRKLKSKGLKTIAIGTRLGQKLQEAADQCLTLPAGQTPFYLGIDLGTTYTVVGLCTLGLDGTWETNALELPVYNEFEALENRNLIPSSVRFSAAPRAEVGYHVRRQFVAHQNVSILDWKRFMGVLNPDGTRYRLPLRKLDPAEAQNPPYLAGLFRNGQVAPEEAAAGLLHHIREKLAELYPETAGIVITHPASYETDAIQATKQAAVLAGWDEDEIVMLAEPKAALYDFLHSVKRCKIKQPLDFMSPKRILVYDLGGGTLDVSMHEVVWNQKLGNFMIQDLAIGSRTRVGGELTDDLIARYVQTQYRQQLAQLPAEHQERFYLEVRLYATKFKATWGQAYAASLNKPVYTMNFQGNFADIPVRLPINREKFQEILGTLLCQDLCLEEIERLDPATAFDHPPFSDRMNTFVVPVLELLLKMRQNGVAQQVDGILLNGGMTRFPLVQERLAQLFGENKLLRQGSPDLAVGKGAALYAAGVHGVDARRVCGSNIYLEINRHGTIGLQKLVAQGQQYPYQTRLAGFQLPAAKDGELLLNIWFGMGSTPGVNTTLQRLRRIPLEAIHQTIAPEARLDLQVEYTLDERLILELVDTRTNKHFQVQILEDGVNMLPVAGKKTLPAPLQPQQTITNTIRIKQLKRSRPFRDSNGHSVNFREWQQLAKEYDRDAHSNTRQGFLEQKIRALREKSATADNRVEIVREFCHWLQDDWANTTPRIQKVALHVCQEILACFPAGNQEIVGLEQELHDWAQQFLQTEPYLKSKLQMLQSLLSLPVHLHWRGWDSLLRAKYQEFQNVGFGVPLLDTMGKCCQPTQANLAILYKVIEHGPLAPHREKAAWSTGRLLSPYQPPEYLADAKQIPAAIKIFLQALSTQQDARVVSSLLYSLYQLVAWVPFHGLTLSPEAVSQIRRLPELCQRSGRLVRANPSIEKNIMILARLLPVLLNLEKATAEEQRQINEYLLEML